MKRTHPLYADGTEVRCGDRVREIDSGCVGTVSGCFSDGKIRIHWSPGVVKDGGATTDWAGEFALIPPKVERTIEVEHAAAVGIMEILAGNGPEGFDFESLPPSVADVIAAFGQAITARPIERREPAGR